MVISVDTGKACTKYNTYTCFKKKKALRKVEIEGNFLNKGHLWKTYSKPQLKGEKLNTFPLSSGQKQVCPFWPLLFSTILDIVPNVIKKITYFIHTHINLKVGEEEVKLSLFTDSVIMKE